MKQTDFEYLIVGAGPAGLQLAYFLEKHDRDYLILERAESAGAFFSTFPRHRQLISINKPNTGTNDREMNLRWDWNSLLSDDDDLLFTRYSNKYFPSADVLPRYLSDYAARHELRIRFATEVVGVHKNEAGVFEVTTGSGTVLTGKRLVVATGIFKPYVPEIPGIDLCENYIDHDVDPDRYINKRVLVVGKGNSAFETAGNLVETAAAIHICSPESVRFAWQTHFVGNLRAVNNNFLDTYQLKSQNTIIDADITLIEKHDGKYRVHISYTHAAGQQMVVEYDHVVVCTGFVFDTSIFDDSCKPDLSHMDRFPAQTSEWESTNVGDLYFAGTLMQACDFKQTMSGFIHGFRHNIQTLANLFELKYHGGELPSTPFEATTKATCDLVFDRVNRAPGMFLQPGFLGDVMVIDEASRTGTYYTDLRLDYVRDTEFAAKEHYYTISLEYGHFDGDPFSLERDPHPNKANEAAYLHPVIRRFSRGELLEVKHIQDDLESQWVKDIYVEPAMAWFEEQFRPLAAEREALVS